MTELPRTAAMSRDEAVRARTRVPSPCTKMRNPENPNQVPISIHPASATVTAFVTGADHPTGLGAARGLRAAGARVVGFAERPESPTCRSRAWSEVRQLRARTTEAMAEEVLSHAAESFGPTFLLPTQDELVLAFACLRDRLPPTVHTGLPGAEIVRVLLDKTRFSVWAAERGYPVPRTAVLRTPEQMTAVVRDFPFPAVLKPMVRTPRWLECSPAEKVIRLRGPADVSEVDFDLFEAAPAYVLSEWIEGEDSDVLFCLTYLDADSEMVASFTGRKLLQAPRLTGSTAVCVGVDDPELTALAARLFREVGCTGLASLEVKRSSTDGRYLITEPTVGRPNLQSPAAQCGGRNLVGIAMRHALGQDHSDLLGPDRPCVWIEEDAVFRLVTSWNGPPLQYRLVLREVLEARRVRGAYWRGSDPAPLAGVASAWLRRGVRRLRL